jgi:hypothetical protein
MSDKVQMRNGDAVLVMVKDGKVIHYSWNMALPHVEFVRGKPERSPMVLGLARSPNSMGKLWALLPNTFSITNYRHRQMLIPPTRSSSNERIEHVVRNTDERIAFVRRV